MASADSRLDQLPIDVLLHVAAQLDVIDVIHGFGLVCTNFNEIAHSDELWKRLVLRDYRLGRQLINAPGQIWLDYYKARMGQKYVGELFDNVFSRWTLGHDKSDSAKFWKISKLAQALRKVPLGRYERGLDDALLNLYAMTSARRDVPLKEQILTEVTIDQIIAFLEHQAHGGPWRLDALGAIVNLVSRPKTDTKHVQMALVRNYLDEIWSLRPAPTPRPASWPFRVAIVLIFVLGLWITFSTKGYSLSTYLLFLLSVSVFLVYNFGLLTHQHRLGRLVLAPFWLAAFTVTQWEYSSVYSSALLIFVWIIALSYYGVKKGSFLALPFLAGHLCRYYIFPPLVGIECGTLHWVIRRLIPEMLSTPTMMATLYPMACQAAPATLSLIFNSTCSIIARVFNLSPIKLFSQYCARFSPNSQFSARWTVRWLVITLSSPLDAWRRFGYRYNRISVQELWTAFIHGGNIGIILGILGVLFSCPI